MHFDDGRGEGVIDRLRQLGHDMTEVNFGGLPMNVTKFQNIKAELWSSMADWIKARGAIPASTELIADLCGPTFTFSNSSNKFELESKERMRARGVRSSDLGDALALTFYGNPTPKGEFDYFVESRRRAREYDPYSEGQSNFGRLGASGDTGELITLADPYR